ncbi:MAG: helix-turn-helix domain-containing protein [Actinomycetota bacterium]|nr:helix-turn-helix domain-containing protein [Actinomycetota bacterium]
MPDEKGPCGAPVLFTVRQAAEHFGVTDKTVRRWLDRGKIDKIQPDGPGGLVWMRVDQLLRASQDTSDDSDGTGGV